MKHFDFRRYCYVFLWLGLLLAVGGVWLLGGASKGGGDSSSGQPVSTAREVSPRPTASSDMQEGQEGLLGVWVPYMALDTEEHTQEAFEANFRRIADSAKEKGLNALFVHVRPFCDALYPSELYPWSHILTGEQGKDPGFDPLEFMVEYAHSLGMGFHAWINPLRVKTAQTPAALADTNPYRTLGESSPYYFMEWEGGIYLDPAYPYVRSLIADGAAEIVRKYKVDGIHFDDYFYPSQEESLDSEAYDLYAQSVETPLPLLEWRQGNIDALLQEVYGAVKKADSGAVFGVSPQGNIENDENMGADVKAWCAVPGLVDYICPQLYYSYENPALGYGEALEQWLSLPRAEEVELYAGLALYKAGTDADGGTWEAGTLRRQIEQAQARQCSGVLLYSCDYLDAEETREEVREAMAALDGWQ